MDFYLLWILSSIGAFTIVMTVLVVAWVLWSLWRNEQETKRLAQAQRVPWNYDIQDEVDLIVSAMLSDS